MIRAAPLLLAALLVGCGSELTDLIARKPCVDPTSYPGGGVREIDVSVASSMTLNGRAALLADALRLTDASRDAIGSAYFTESFYLDAQSNLFARFALRMSGGDLELGADGVAFVIQSSADGPRALGRAGGGLGYQNVKPSFSVEFDTHPNPPDPPGRHIALMRDGDIDHGLISSVDVPFFFNDGVVRNVWIDYQASLQKFDVYVSDAAVRPAVPLLSQPALDLASLGPAVYMGFSASSGARFNDHDLIGESWAVTTALPRCER